MAGTLIKQTGRLKQIVTTSDGISVVQMNQTILPHAFSHMAGGSDSINVGQIGGMTTQDIRKAIAESAKQCSSNMPNDIERKVNKGRRNGYCPLDGNAKVPVQNLPEFLQGGAYLTFDTVFPGQLQADYVSGATPIDLLYPPIASYLVMAYAMVMTAPTGADINIQVYADTVLITTLVIAIGATTSGTPFQIPASTFHFGTVTKPFKLILSKIGSTYPGEYLRVRTICKTYTPPD